VETYKAVRTAINGQSGSAIDTIVSDLRAIEEQAPTMKFHTQDEFNYALSIVQAAIAALDLEPVY